MRCPIDGRELVLAHREGIELDYCPECRGIWLDRGEIDKLIERSNQQLMAAAVPRSDRYERSDRDEHKYEPKKKKKASSFLSDLLEFG